MVELVPKAEICQIFPTENILCLNIQKVDRSQRDGNKTKKLGWNVNEETGSSFKSTTSLKLRRNDLKYRKIRVSNTFKRKSFVYQDAVVHRGGYT